MTSQKWISDHRKTTYGWQFIGILVNIRFSVHEAISKPLVLQCLDFLLCIE